MLNFMKTAAFGYKHQRLSIRNYFALLSKTQFLEIIETPVPRCRILCGASAPLCSRWCLPSWSPTSSTTGPTRSMTGWRNCSSGPLVLTINYRGQRKQPGQFDHEEWWNIKRSANTLYCSHVKACLINSANWFTVAQVIGISIGNPFCLLWRSSRCLVVVWAE